MLRVRRLLRRRQDFWWGRGGPRTHAEIRGRRGSLEGLGLEARHAVGEIRLHGGSEAGWDFAAST